MIEGLRSLKVSTELGEDSQILITLGVEFAIVGYSLVAALAHSS